MRYDVAVVGACRNEDRTGAAYVFRYEDDQWNRQQKLTAGQTERPISESGFLNFHSADPPKIRLHKTLIGIQQRLKIHILLLKVMRLQQ